MGDMGCFSSFATRVFHNVAIIMCTYYYLCRTTVYLVLLCINVRLSGMIGAIREINKQNNLLCTTESLVFANLVSVYASQHLSDNWEFRRVAVVLTLDNIRDTQTQDLVLHNNDWLVKLLCWCQLSTLVGSQSVAMWEVLSWPCLTP